MLFEDQLKWGEEGERLVARWFMSKGYVVAPLYQFDANTAPVLVSSKGKLVAPDLSLFGNSKMFFAEIKRKNRWVSSKAHGLETGYNLGQHKHYLEVKHQTGCPVWILFLHETRAPTGLFAAELGAQPVRRWDGLHHLTGEVISAKRMVFYKHENLIPLCSLEEIKSYDLGTDEHTNNVA